MVIAETLPIDVDHQQISLVPAAFPQLAQLFSAAFDRLAADATTRDTGRLSHLGQNFLVLTGRNSTQQRSHHALRSGSVRLQRFIRRYFHFAFLLMTKPRPLHFQLAVGERHPTILRTVPADIPTDLSRRLLPGHVLGAQRQNCFDGLAPDRADDLINGDSGLTYQFEQRQQQLPVSLCELLDTHTRGFLVPTDDMIRFFHAVVSFQKGCFWRIDSNEPTPTAAPTFNYCRDTLTRDV